MKKVPHLVLFAIAMGYLEAAVVVYLRELYYPSGFHFPITIISNKIAFIEIGREFATVVMLAVPAVLAARGFYGRFAAFSLMFGVWDIVYYVSLKATLGWPASLMTWDILFLIPVPWVGPVIAPCIISVCLIAGALLVFRAEDRRAQFESRPWEWALATAGGLIVVVSFTIDFQQVVAGGEHGTFKWPVFLAGLAMGWTAFISILRRAMGLDYGC
jgi:hypothetical protein